MSLCQIGHELSHFSILFLHLKLNKKSSDHINTKIVNFGQKKLGLFFLMLIELCIKKLATFETIITFAHVLFTDSLLLASRLFFARKEYFTKDYFFLKKVGLVSNGQ